MAGNGNHGYKFTEADKLKMSLAHKGQMAWNKGKSGYKNKPASDETKRNISIGNKGKKKTEKHKLSLRGPRPNTRGEKNPNWNGGNSRGYKTGYYSVEYKEWRLGVFERDGFRCQGCGAVGGYLTAHHIKSFAHYPKLRFVLDNGITLCEDCHKLTDNYKGRANKK